MDLSSEQNLKVWYKRPEVLILIALNVFTVGFLLPSLVAFLRKLKQRKLIAIANVVSVVVSVQLSSPAIFLVCWSGLMLVTIFSKQNRIVALAEESPVVAMVESTPSKPVWDPPQVAANSKIESQPVSSTLNQKQPEIPQIEVTPDFIWSIKAEKKKANITRRLATILVDGEQVYGVTSTNRIKGAVVDFICATDVRLMVFNSNGSFDSKYEWALWSDLHPVMRKTNGIFPNTIQCQLKDGTEMPMGQLLETASCDQFFQIINQFVASPPNLNLESKVREVELGRLNKARKELPESLNKPVVDKQHKQKMSFTQWVKFKSLYRKQISVTENSLKNTYAMNIGLHTALHGFKRQVDQIDENMFNSTSEQNILFLSGCSLIEVRKGARVTHRESSYSGSSSGGSVRVGRVRVGGGSHSGSSSSTSISYPAPDELTRIDRGNFLITNLRATFVGSMFTKSAEFKKIADYKPNSHQLLIAPRTGSKVWIVEFPSIEQAWVAELLLETAFATPQKRLDDKAESIYGNVLAELKSNFDRRVAEIELALQDSEDELLILREAWGEFMGNYPGRLDSLVNEMSGEKPDLELQRTSSMPVTLSLKWVPSGVNEKIEIIKAIRAATNLSLTEAKNAVENVPSILGTNFDLEIAEILQSQLRQLGAAAEIS